VSEFPDYSNTGRDLVSALRAAVTGNFEWTGIIVENTADMPSLAAMAIGYAARMLQSYARVFASHSGMNPEQHSAFLETELTALAEGRPGALMPTPEGGFQLRLPDGETVGHMLGLVHSILWDDEAAQQAILDTAELRTLTYASAVALAGCLTAAARHDETDLDTPTSALTDEQLHHAEAILIAAITRADDDPRPEGGW
jgi:hypothetical protein